MINPWFLVSYKENHVTIKMGKTGFEGKIKNSLLDMLI